MRQLVSLQTVRDKRALEQTLQKLKIKRVSWRRKIALVKDKAGEQKDMVLYILTAPSEEHFDIDMLCPISSVQIKNIQWKNLEIAEVRQTAKREYLIIFKCKKPPHGFRNNKITIDPEMVIFHLADEHHPQAKPLQVICQL